VNHIMATKVIFHLVIRQVSKRKACGIVYLRSKPDMEEPDFTIFSRLYHSAYRKCFKQPLHKPLNETESKLFYQQLLEHTGLTVGWRSLKNYSFYVLGVNNNKQENPAVATLDTLARYVLHAPYTTEINRKNNESHHPYWFMYRQQHLDNNPSQKINKAKQQWLVLFFLAMAIGSLALIYNWYNRKKNVSFIDDFYNVSDSSLAAKGWQLVNKDAGYWKKRDSQKGLTLFTLLGDNWPDKITPPSIKNLLIRELPSGCLSAELQMQDFIPSGEWQQAGILLMADTSLNSPSMRISLAYNDYFGGYQRSGEVIIQAIASQGKGAKPEEFAHVRLLSADSINQKPALLNNLKYTALRIEKQKNSYRILYSGGLDIDAAFKEIAVKDMNFDPHYIAIFALKGRVDKTPVIPVVIKKFILLTLPCN